MGFVARYQKLTKQVFLSIDKVLNDDKISDTKYELFYKKTAELFIPDHQKKTVK